MSASAVLPPSYAAPLARPRTGLRARSTAAVRTRYRRQTAALMLGTTVAGLWFGIAAPSVSPVAPTSPLPVVAAAADPAGDASGGGLDSSSASTTTNSGAAGDVSHRGDGRGPQGRGGRAGHR